MVTSDDAVIERAMRRVLDSTARLDMAQSPPEMARLIHGIIKDETGMDDPYAAVKRESTATALGLIDDVRRRIDAAADPFDAAVRFAIAGNVMDFAIPALKDMNNVKAHLDKALSQRLVGSGTGKLKAALLNAETVLFLGDNAGETVFDRLLIERISVKTIRYVVKASPIINDSTVFDAEASGISEVAEIMDNGSDAPGTVLRICSDSFRERFRDADVVIAKGQANYETLSGVDREVFFLTQVKCPVIACDVGRDVGDWLVTSLS